MRSVLATLCLIPLVHGAVTEDFIAAATSSHGTAGESAARFLVDHMPEKDRQSLSLEFLRENLDLAFASRGRFPWAKTVPAELFHNDVLPYAVFDEARDPWRAQLLEIAAPIVKDARSASEAAQLLNRDLFKAIKVQYHTGRKAPNQSARESIASGRASCTGLSILLVNACRAVGIPARAVGTPMWVNQRGNHTWVEIWDGSWHFTGAGEYDPEGLNRAWFSKDAAAAKADDPRHAIFASSWKKSGLSFPLIWSPQHREVAAVNVTARYAQPSPVTDGSSLLGVRLFDRRGGQRLAARLRAYNDKAQFHLRAETKAGTSDLNDLPRLAMPAGASGTLTFRVGHECREMAFGPLAAGESTLDAVWSELKPCSAAISALEAWLDDPGVDRDAGAPALMAPLSKSEAAKATALLGADRLTRLAAERKAEMDQRQIVLGDKTLRWLEKSFGHAAHGERSLWISMHGGGNAPPAINDQQWQNQIRLYQPQEGIYLAPRAPTDTWNLWHEGHIDPMFERLIANHVALRGVDPDKVYLMGYSAGGDGVWQLAPRMADRFAAASMMAGHPNEASLLGLRNLPFAIFMGGEDAAYQRNEIAARKSVEIAALHQADPGGYRHLSRIYKGLGHWMQLKDAEALPWMAAFRRNPWPEKIVWFQDDITHRRFYWLQLRDDDAPAAGQSITARIDGQHIQLEGDVPPKLTLMLSDALLDLDRELTVSVRGKTVVQTKVVRQAKVIRRHLETRFDIPATPTAALELP